MGKLQHVFQQKKGVGMSEDVSQTLRKQKISIRVGSKKPAIFEHENNICLLFNASMVYSGHRLL